MEAFLMNLATRPERNHTTMEIRFAPLQNKRKPKKQEKTIVFSYVILVFLCFLIARFADYLAWGKLYVVKCFISDISNAGCSTLH